MQTRQISATLCRVYRQRTHLHSDRAYVQGQPSRLLARGRSRFSQVHAAGGYCCASMYKEISLDINFQNGIYVIAV